ncbi:carbohydrate kinase family protein [Fodinibius salsisoli]|uniref:Carbohydrate kinase n=1 Tax=Fodinibius salsisoli TaxID=2820877 RepID=A0ABT3PPV9_9BACT|nr:carbohydrate kinase [Fodinibius salsisoli]MCW9707891.1 carbohydrate kinase [Fodinibius salsisoli]
MEDETRILCIGEILWDALPMGLFLGGAPLNVSCHLQQLGEDVKMISRIGNDRLGKEAMRRITHKQLATDLIQWDQELETGFVEVQLDKKGHAEYQFMDPVAWDHIELTEQVEQEVEHAWALVFGSLALRHRKSRQTIKTLLRNDRILKVCDINLREPFYDRKSIEYALKATDILKVNETELGQLIDWFDLPQKEQLAIEKVAQIFKCETVTVTKGCKGASLYHQGQWAEHAGFQAEVKDTVGAGDAFLATLLKGLRMGKDVREVLILANASGASVASQFGATPKYSFQDIIALAQKNEVPEKTKRAER